MSQEQEIRTSHLPLEGPGASPEAGSDERQKANLLRKHVEQSLRDMAKSAQTMRDVLMSAQSSEGSRDQALIEYEERIAAIQALAQGVLDPQSHIYTLGDRSSALPTSDSHTLSRDEEKQTKGEHGIDITSERSDSNEEEENTIPGNMGREKREDPEPRQLPLPPQPNTPPAAAVPLHLIPLVSPKSSPSNRRRTSFDPSTTINDEDTIDLQQGRRNLPNATSETTFASQSDLWHFQTRAAAETPISRTLAYAMGRTQIVGSSHRPIPRDAGVDRKEVEGTKRDGAEPEKDPLSPVVTARSGTGGDQADVAERMSDGAVQHTKVATHENREMIEEKLGREEKRPRKVTPSDVEAGRIRENVGEMMTVAEDAFEDQDQHGAEIEQMDVHEGLVRDGADDPVTTSQDMKLAQSQPEGKYNKLMKLEMDIHGTKQKVEILEETLQAREKDLCNRLETVRQRLQAIRQRKILIERQEDSLRQKLVDARREQGLEEASEPKLATTQETQGAGVGVEAEVVSEEPSQHCASSKVYNPTRSISTKVPSLPEVQAPSPQFEVT